MRRLGVGDTMVNPDMVNATKSQTTKLASARRAAHDAARKTRGHTARPSADFDGGAAVDRLRAMLDSDDVADGAGGTS